MLSKATIRALSRKGLNPDDLRDKTEFEILCIPEIDVKRMEEIQVHLGIMHPEDTKEFKQCERILNKYGYKPIKDC